MLTTWPVLTEAMHLIGDALGWRGQEALWRTVRRRDLQLAGAQTSTVDRMERLMSKYRDVPMDLAHASLVAVAEELGLTMVFSLDRHFRVYRVHNRRLFAVVP
jgi:predicted nucleic acid-binding protein